MSIQATQPPTPAESTFQLDLTPEELSLLRATIAFQAQYVTDPDLRQRLERTAAKLDRLAPGPTPA